MIYYNDARLESMLDSMYNYMLDGYYYSDYRINTEQNANFEFTATNVSIDENSDYVFASEIDYTSSRYYWSNNYKSSNTDWTGTLASLGAISGSVAISLPTKPIIKSLV